MKPGMLSVDAVVGSTRKLLRRWIKPEIEQLPRLSELTLQSPIPGGGGTGGGGSTVIP